MRKRNKGKVSITISNDIITFVKAYAEEQEIAFSSVIERLVLKGMETTDIKLSPKDKFVPEEKVEYFGTDENEIALMGMFDDMPD